MQVLFSCYHPCRRRRNCKKQDDDNYTLFEKLAQALSERGRSCGGAQNFGNGTTTAAALVGCSARQAWHARIWANIVDNPWQAKVVAEMRGCLDPNSIRMLKATFFPENKKLKTHLTGAHANRRRYARQRVDTGFAPNSSGFDSASFDGSPTVALLLEV